MSGRAAGVGALLGWFSLDPSRDPQPLYRCLFSALRDAIRSGALAPGTRLPSSRTLAGELEVSRNTVVLAFEMLVAEGWVESRVGDGSYVSRGLRSSDETRVLASPSPSRRGLMLLAARVLLDPGDAVWVEDPGYSGARGALLGAGVELVPVPVDAEGIAVAEGRRRRGNARLACVTPSHQYPTGVTLSLARRESLLEWAEASDAWVVEDDYDSEFRYSGRPLEALQGLARNARVVYVGTFSKVWFPALRLAWLVAPAALVDAFRAARVLMDGHPPPFPQAVLADLFDEGHFAAHVRRMRRIYRERRDALLDALRPLRARGVHPGSAEAGMHLTVWLDPDVDDVALARRGLELGLDLTPLSQYALNEPRPRGLLLGFACAPPEALVAGVRQLATLLD